MARNKIKKKLRNLITRYKDAGVTNQTKDVTGGYELDG